MNNFLKLLISISFIAFLAIAGWFFFHETKDQKALHAFQQGLLEDSIRELEKNKEKFSSAEFALLNGYIEREKGDLQRSNADLQAALNQSSKPRLKEEILINQAYNAFLEKDRESLHKAVKELEKLRSKWSPFFNSLASFLKHGNTSNLSKLEKISVPTSLSPWMETAFSSSFTPYWYGIRNATSLIEEGNTVQARQQLDKLSETAGKMEKEQLTYLIGLSYLKEASERPAIAATPYYKLAVSYLNRIPFYEERFQKERSDAVSRLQRQIQSLIEEKQFQDFPFYATLIEEWGSGNDRKSFAEQLVQLIKSDENSEGILEALSVLKSEKQVKESLVEWNISEIQNSPFGTVTSQSKQEFSEELAWSLPLQQFLFERGENAFRQGNMEEAENNLRIGLFLAPLSNPAMKLILPLSATIFFAKGDPYDAALAWNKYFSFEPKSGLNRIDFAKALMAVMRYDLAASQLNFLDQNAHLDPSEKILFIKSLILSGHFEEGKNQALSSVTKLKGNEAVILSGIVYPLFDRDLNEKINKQIPPKETWDRETQLAGFEAALNKGDYREAASLMKEIEPPISDTVQGQFLIAKFYSQNGDFKNAIKYAKEAYKKEPKLVGIQSFIAQHTFDPQSLKAILSELNYAIQKDPENLQLQFERSQSLIDLALAQQDHAEIPISKMPELLSAHALLLELAPKGTEFPFFHFLYGLSFFLQDNDETAINSFEKAIQLNPGYSDAAKYLALAYARKGEVNRASQVLMNSLKYHPTDGEGWLVLADIYIGAGGGVEAGIALDNAIRYRPNHINTLLSAAQYKLELQNPQAALPLVEKILKLNPKNQSALVLQIKIFKNPLMGKDRTQEELEKKIEETLNALGEINPQLADKLKKDSNP